MAYHTILTFCDGDAGSDARLDAAIACARERGAFLRALAVGYDPDLPQYAFAGASAAIMTDLIEEARAAADKRAETIDAKIREAGVMGEAEPVQASFAGFPRALAERANFADLVVLDPPYAENASAQAPDAFAGVVFDSLAPALVLSGAAYSTPKTALIAWNRGIEALKAVRAALPLLEQAETVEIAVFADAPAPDYGSRLSAYLGRHGVEAEVSIHPQRDGAVSQAIADRAKEVDANLLVMGAYGHTRVREYLVGGVTRELLANPPCPIFTTH